MPLQQGQIANQVFEQFKVGYHIHNGIDAPTIPTSSISKLNSLVTSTTVTLTSSQILALHGTPITLIPAQGANTIIVVTGIAAFLRFNSAAYVGTNNLEFRYTNGSGAKVTADMSSTFLNSSSNAYDLAPAVSTELTPVANSSIVVSVPTANPTTGNSQITFTIHYYVVTFT